LTRKHNFYTLEYHDNAGCRAIIISLKTGKGRRIMRKSAYLGLAAAIAVAAVSCGETGAELSVGGDDGATGTYTIKIADGIENGAISANRSAGNKGQIVIVSASPAAASAWEGAAGEEPASADENAVGGGGDTQYPWYLNSLSITAAGKAVSYTKAGPNEWTFKMPEGNVVISGTFSQTPVKSNELAILDVSVSATVVPKLASNQYDYTADIPHTIQTASENTEPEEEKEDDDTEPTVQTFRIIAVPEDPQAEVTVAAGAESSDTEDSGEYELAEGKKEFTITVFREDLTPDTHTYTFTVNYWPDLGLSSIELSSAGHNDWTHNVPVKDEQTIITPYRQISIGAIANDIAVTVAASTTSNSASLTKGASDWTLEFPESPSQLSSTVKIKSSKTVGGGVYEKDYILNFVKPAAGNEPPNSFWAASAGATIVQDKDGAYYEVHTFTADSTLTFNVESISNSNLKASVLVVAGGGGGGGGNWPSFGGGAGGVVEANNYSLTEQSYDVVVGLGGAGGYGTNGTRGDGKTTNDNEDGKNGGDSKFGNGITAYGGGGGAKRNGDGKITQGFSGQAGGSSGGGTTSPAVKAGNGGTSYGNIGGIITESGDTSAGGGGAGGSGNSGAVRGDNNTTRTQNFGGPGISSSITGAPVIYAAGGDATPYSGGNDTTHRGNDGAPNTGNGGGGAWNNSGGNGGSGVVIVRFPARPNEDI
jgi:hypothetical protein